MRYTLMHGRYPVCDFTTDDGTSIDWVGKIQNPDRLPLQCQQPGREVREVFGFWWQNRGIPRSRPHISPAEEAHNVWNMPALELCNLGVSLSDHYWARPQGRDELTWESINCFTNDFPMGCGNLLFYNQRYAETLGGKLYNSPDASTNGNLRKHWVVDEDGTRSLVKAGGFNELNEAICEVVFAEAAKFLGVETANTTLLVDTPEGNVEHVDEPCCSSELLTSVEEEIVTANAIKFSVTMDDRLSLYENTVEMFGQLCGRDMRPELEKMLIVDYLFCNQDRHFSSFGLMRNSETMQYTGMCKLFDNGATFWNDCIFTDAIGLSDTSITFSATQTEQVHLVHNIDWLDQRKLTELTSMLYNRFLSYQQFATGAVPTEQFMQYVEKVVRAISFRVSHLEYAM